MVLSGRLLLEKTDADGHLSLVRRAGPGEPVGDLAACAAGAKLAANASTRWEWRIQLASVLVSYNITPKQIRRVNMTDGRVA